MASSLNSSTNLLTPPTTPDYECGKPNFGQSPPLELLSFDQYQHIVFRGEKTEEGIRVKVNDLISHFKLNVAYMRTVTPYLVVYSLRDLYRRDFSSIVGSSEHDDSTLFSEYAQSNELYITYKGIEILAFNVPKLMPFREWLESVLDSNLHCYEEIDYDQLGW